MKLKDITEEDIWDIADYSAILARGLNYYETGQIESMDVSGEKITAKVRGSYGMYDVEIAIEDGKIHADCDCPYDGYGCKHIVAVLYKWVKGEKEGGGTTRKEIDISKELSKLSKEELKSILMGLWNDYEEVQRDILLKIRGSPDVNSAAKDIIHRQIKDAFYTRGGFIDYYDLFGVVENLEKIKDTILAAPPDMRTPLLKELVRRSLDAIESCDDSSGQLGDFIVECLTDLGKALHEQKLSFREKKRIIKENLDKLDEEEYGLEDGYINLVLEIPSTEEDFSFLIDELKTRMGDKKGTYEKEIYRGMLTEAYRRAGRDEEYLALLEENAREKGDYLPLVQFWKEKGDVEKAITIAEEVIDAGKTDAIVDLLEFLEKIYQENNNWEDLLRISIRSFKEIPRLKKYRDIKSIAEKLQQWEAVKPELIKHAKGEELVKIYLFEKDYDMAFEKVMNPDGWLSEGLKNKVALALMKENPENALKIYLPMVQQFIDKGKRDAYRIAALYAKKVKEIHLQLGLEDEWSRYITKIREDNKRRPALMQEFRRL